jgi:hypothetical protein
MTEGAVLFTGMVMLGAYAAGLELSRMREKNDELFHQAYRRRRVDLMHDLARNHQRLNTAIRWNLVSVATAVLCFLIMLNLYVTAHY